jgi:ribosomal protein L7/L12
LGVRQIKIQTGDKMNYHKKVLELILNTDISYKDAFCKIATKHPFAVYDALVENEEKKKKKLDAMLLNIAKTSNKIEAIKRYRNLTGTSLYEAKTYIDNLVGTA